MPADTCRWRPMPTSKPLDIEGQALPSGMRLSTERSASMIRSAEPVRSLPTDPIVDGIDTERGQYFTNGNCDPGVDAATSMSYDRRRRQQHVRFVQRRLPNDDVLNIIQLAADATNIPSSVDLWAKRALAHS